MKNILVFVLMFIGTVCSSQTPILPLFDYDGDPYVSGAYYKDTFNDFDNFTGTWQYTNAGTSLIIKLQKRIQYYSTIRKRYYDMVIGEYKYIENGIEKINTLNHLIQNYPDPFDYNLVGKLITTAGDYPICTNCSPNEKLLILNFTDPSRSEVLGLDGEIILRRVDSGSTQKLELILQQTGNLYIIDDVEPAYSSFNVPWGKYILTKVN